MILNVKKMKSIFFVISTLIIVGCSKESSELKPQISSLEEGAGDFGSLNFNQSLDKIFTFKNETMGRILVTPEITGMNSGSFSIVSSRGCQEMDPQRICQIKIQVAARGLVSGSHQATLSVAPFNSVPLTVSINPSPAPIIEVQVEGVVASSLSFEIQGKKSVTKVVAFKNIGSVLAPMAPLTKDLASLAIISNSCPAELPPSKLCYLRVTMKGQNLAENLQGLLSLGSTEIPVNYVSSVSAVEEKIEAIETSIDLGNFNDSRQKQVRILSFLNTGNISSSLVVSPLPPGYKIVSSTCSNVAPKGKCFVKVEFSAPESGSGMGSHLSNLNLGTNPININYGIVSSRPLTTIGISGEDNILTNTCEAYQISLRDDQSNFHVQENARAFNLSGGSAFSDSSCSSPISELSFGSYESQKNIYLKSTTPGPISLIIQGAITSSKSLYFYNSLDITPKNSIITVDNSVSYSNIGGKPPYVFSKISGVGTINSGTGYYSSTEVGSATIMVEDSLGHTATTDVSVTDRLVLTAGECDIETHHEGLSCMVLPSGGVGSLTFFTDKGSINSSSGHFISSCAEGNQANIEVVDSIGNRSSIDFSYACVYKSCFDAKQKMGLNTELNTSSGKYFINGGRSTIFKAYCDQVTDGGGWTLVSYAGNIDINKVNTTGSTNFLPLFNAFGSYDVNALTSKNSFSRVDLIKPLAHYNSRFLARRTSVPNNQISFRLANVDWWGSNLVNPTSSASVVDNTAAFLKATITGNSGWQEKNNAFYENTTSAVKRYPGIRWNTTAYENCDESVCPGRTFTTSLNRRSILYWEADDVDSITRKQWFHASPLSLTGSVSLSNEVRDVEFYFRENLHPISCDDAKQKGSVNVNGNTGNGNYQIDPDGYNYGVAPSAIYCDTETDPLFGYQEVAVASFDSSKILAGKQFVKLTTVISNTGPAAGVRVVGLFPLGSSINYIAGKPVLNTTTAYALGSGSGYNHMGTDNYFYTNFNAQCINNLGVQCGSVSVLINGAVVYNSGIVSKINIITDGLSGEVAYIYSTRYNYTLWERP